jgi:hypothetical protein
MTQTIDHVELLRSSEKFRQWHVEPTPVDNLDCNMMAERHYTPEELAELWAVSTETVRSIFREEPGVLRVVKEDKPKNKRAYVTMRIPESVAERVHNRLSAVPG